jgi:hypothetical protein
MVDQFSAWTHFILHVLPLGLLVGGVTFGVGLATAYFLFRTAKSDCEEREERERLLESRRKLLQEDCISIEKSLGDLGSDYVEGGKEG